MLRRSDKPSGVHGVSPARDRVYAIF